MRTPPKPQKRRACRAVFSAFRQGVLCGHTELAEAKQMTRVFSAFRQGVLCGHQERRQPAEQS